jgi:superfamily I DNA/RNA helicase
MLLARVKPLTNSFELTEEQRCFIEKAPPESVLIACPGSGKTRTAVLRFIERCKAANDHGIAFLSYTNVAVEEALSRARESNAGGLVGYPNLVSTIDSFLRRFIFEPFIRCVYEQVPVNVAVFESRPPAAIAGDKTYALWGIKPDENFKGRKTKVELWAWDARAYLADDGHLRYEYNRDRFGQDWVDVPARFESTILAAKVSYLGRGYATYDDVLLYCRLLLAKEDLNVAPILARRFGEIVVDEAQDTSAIQQDVLGDLADAGSKICYIGDPKQGIYQFNRANPAYLEELACDSHEQFTLTKNFRSIGAIVGVVNRRFDTEMAHHRDPKHNLHGAYVFVGTEEQALKAFNGVLERADISLANAAVIVRSRKHLSSTLQDYEAKGWRIGPRLALEAWQRERRMDIEGSLASLVRLLRVAATDEALCAKDEPELRELGWLFFRREHFPEPSSEETPKAWATRLRAGIEGFLKSRGLPLNAKCGDRFATNGLADKGFALEEFTFVPPIIRTTVIHQVKGESISAVLVVAPTKQHKTWLDNNASAEEQNVCYVAFTRAADLLVLHCPTQEIAAEWREHGFTDLP